MKGGGFLVFLFLLFCFLWGIAAIMGGLREAVRSWFAKPIAPMPAPAARPVPRAQEQTIADVITLPSGALSKAEFEAMKQRLLKSHLSA